MERKTKIKMLTILTTLCTLSGCGPKKEYDPEENIFTPKPYKVVPTDKYKKTSLDNVNSNLVNLGSYNTSYNYDNVKVLIKAK